MGNAWGRGTDYDCSQMRLSTLRASILPPLRGTGEIVGRVQWEGAASMGAHLAGGLLFAQTLMLTPRLSAPNTSLQARGKGSLRPLPHSGEFGAWTCAL